MVGKEGVNLVDVAEPDHRTTLEFTLIGNQKDLTGVLDNGLGSPNLMIVKVEQRSIRVNAGNADDSKINFELADKIDGCFAGNAAITRPDCATCYNDFKTGIAAENHCNVEVVSDNPQAGMIL